MIDLSQRQHTLAVGFATSNVAVASAVAGKVYGMTQISSIGASSSLSNKNKFPYFTRVTPTTDGFSDALVESIVYYSNIQKIGWTDVGVVARTDEFALSLAASFVKKANGKLDIVTYQQYFSEGAELDVDIEMNELVHSGVRVFLAFVNDDWLDFIAAADEFGLVGDHYVWYVPSSVIGLQFPEPSELSRGAIGSFVYVPESATLDMFLELWNEADPTIYPGAGGFTTPFHYLAFDMMITAALAIDQVDKKGLLNNKVSPQMWFDTIVDLEFQGTSGDIRFDGNGDRIAEFEHLYYSPEAARWVPSAIWSKERGYDVVHEVVWNSNTTVLPDLDVREPFDYWSCDNKEERHDPTGKTISLHTPDGGSFDDIDSDYHCDFFIDCHNFSDESVDCSTNYLVLFIVFGVVTGLLILISVLLVLFVLVVGVFLQYRRLRKSSPVFLILVSGSVIIGYCSVFAWFGKPHPAACGFQPWLLGLSAISMITALTVKNIRIYRIFQFPMKKQRITNFDLAGLWMIVMTPALLILILWTIISTPTAKMKHLGGGEHYICATGGFTGEPGGYIFFGIFVGYAALVLLLGAFVSFLIRNVPTEYNETKLLTVSIYNLGFLGVVIIPVFLVVEATNPFVAWILRTLAILYAFTATTLIQFGPIVWGVIILDKGRNVKRFKSNLSNSPHNAVSASDTLS